jgi:asparagine synthase (glutamine-hydrolysing)
MRVRADGSTEENRYWDPLGLARADFMVGKSEEEITCRIVSELRTTVKLHKVSDVPVGVFLSGGIDSSANTALISEGESAVVKTFSIGYQGNYRSYDNELAYAQRVAEKFGSEYHERLLRLDDLIHFLPEMARLQDEPLADPVCVPVYYVSKLARDTGVSVCQVGEGADELFCGYPHWKLALRMESISSLPIPYWFRRLVVQGMTLVGLDKDWRYEFMRRSSLGQPVYWGSEAYSQRQKEALLSPRMRAQFAGKTSWEVIEPIRRRFETQSRDSHPLDWMTYLDLSFRLPELLLMRVDKMSMGVSLEARVPFLDHKFVELAMSIPAELKIRGGELKYILRKALRGIIPDQIIDRKKQGFAAPIEEWFNQGLGEVAKVQLKEFCEATDLLDWPAVDCLLSGERSHRAWPLLNVALWWSTFIKPSEELRPCSREQFQ